MKSKPLPSDSLRTFRWVVSLITIFGLVVPFIMQETFYPFFRFGMFAEPVKRTIQTEQFFLAVPQTDGGYDVQISEAAGIRRSKLDYLLRNYYYRNEADLFLEQVTMLFPAHQLPDTLLMLRKLQNDTSIVARFPKE